MASPEFLTALASVRSSLRDLTNPTGPAGAEWASVARRELSTTLKVHVREALRAGDVLRAANSTYASEPFRNAIERLLVPRVRPLVDELAWAFVSVFDTEDAGGLVIRIDGARASHLPRARRRDGVLRGRDAREVLSAALGDPVVVALWASVQSGADAAPLGFARYAANNSSFVTRQRLFGARVNLSGVFRSEAEAEDGPARHTDAGRYVYDFEEALTCSYADSGDGAIRTERDDDLEYSALLETRRLVGHFSVALFGALFSRLCALTEKELAVVFEDDTRGTLLAPDVRRTLATSAGTDEAAVLELELALGRVLKAMRRSTRHPNAA